MQLPFALETRPLLSRVSVLLLAQHGPQRDPLRLDPVSQLILAILSARTRDEISLAALEHLACRYASWSVLAHAPSQDIESIIHPVTYADRKADQLPRTLRLIAERAGALNLDFLARWPPEEAAMRWLEELPGIGMRNAAATLNFSKLRRRVLSVGTQHLRVGERLGLLPPGTDYARGFVLYMRLVPDEWDADDLYELHWLIKLHGQSRCRHHRPICSGCPLAELCSLRSNHKGRALWMAGLSAEPPAEHATAPQRV
jgi:endonuclease-3